jgi:hypothetical protein
MARLGAPVMIDDRKEFISNEVKLVVTIKTYLLLDLFSKSTGESSLHAPLSFSCLQWAVV